MKTAVHLKTLLVVVAVLSPLNRAISEKYIGVDGPATQIWSGSRVDIGAENICHWSSLTVLWRLNSNGAGDGLSFDQTKSAVQSAFNAWQNVSTADIGFIYGGSTTATWSNDGQNVHYWAEQGDPAFNSTGPLADYNNTLAVTVITINASEEFLDVDIIFNGWKKTWKVDGSDYDIQAVSTHEIGHMIGLHHTEVTTSPLPTMYWQYLGIASRSLEWDDKVGVSFLYRGNLIDNETLSGIDYYYWNLTQYAGKTLTINPGTTLNFAPNKKITINGTLYANGTSSQRVTFTSSTGTWYGIEANNGASVSLTYCTVQNAQYGVWAYHTPLNVDHCTFSSISHTSIRYDNQSGGGVQYSTIQNTSTTGIYCAQYSNPSLYQYNRIRDHYTGVYGDGTSLPNLGNWGTAGNNSIVNSNWDVWSDNVNTVYAIYDWWGSASPSPNVSDNVVWVPYLDYDPTGGMPPAANGGALAKSATTDNDTADTTEFRKAYEVYLGADYARALELFEALVSNYPDAPSG